MEKKSGIVLNKLDNIRLFELCRKALEHGKHVLVDYPLCVSAQGGKDLFNLAESKGMMEREVKKLTFY